MINKCVDCPLQDVLGACQKHDCRKCCKPKYYRSLLHGRKSFLSATQSGMKGSTPYRESRLDPKNMSPQEVIRFLEGILIKIKTDNTMLKTGDRVSVLCRNIEAEISQQKILKAVFQPDNSECESNNGKAEN